MTTKIILDTDIGDDIDDALALAYILSDPALDLLCLSTVYKNTPLRNRIARSLLRAYGRDDIPVAAGVRAPLIAPAPLDESPCQWSDAYADIPENNALHGVELLIDASRAHPDATILAIGPLTNLACAARIAPDVIARMRIVLMGGMVTTPYAEWNVACDPEAAAIVFNTCRDVTVVGLDVTLSCRLSQGDIDRMRAASDPRRRSLFELVERWMARTGMLPILHDPLAALYIADPSLLALTPMSLRVELAGGSRGMTLRQRDAFSLAEPEPNARAATDVDAARAVRRFVDVLFA